MVFEIVDERLPKVPTVEYYDSKRVHDASWNKVDDGDCSPDERPAFILQRLGDLLGWHLAMYEYPAFDNTHQDNVHRSVHYTKEAFLETKVYQAWKTRKIRGPGLLCVTGPRMSTPSLKTMFIKLRVSGTSETDQAPAMTGKTTLWYSP